MDHLGRARRGISILTLLTFAMSAPAAKHYNPAWGPWPPIPPHGMAILPTQRVVDHMIFPILGRCRWIDDYQDSRGGFRHAAIDIKAPKMSPIVAPFSGILGLKSESFWIYGDNRWAMLGTHLNDDNLGTHDRAGCRDVMFAPNLRGGQHVYAGQFIGFVGMSGNATGPHLHFELYAPGKASTKSRVRDPFPSLKMAQVIPAPRIRVKGRRPRIGEMRLLGCVRKIDPKHGEVTLILFAKQMSNGHAAAIIGPRYARFWVSQSTIRRAGGWHAIRSLSSVAPVSFYVPLGMKVDDSHVNRVAIEAAWRRSG